MFIRLQYNINTNNYVIPTATDGTTFKLDDTHPIVTFMVAIGPGQTVVPGYNGTVYSLPNTKDPFHFGRYDNTTHYYIKV